MRQRKKAQKRKERRAAIGAIAGFCTVFYAVGSMEASPITIGKILLVVAGLIVFAICLRPFTLRAATQRKRERQTSYTAYDYAA